MKLIGSHVILGRTSCLMQNKEGNWGDDCFTAFITILAFALGIGGGIAFESFWAGLIFFLIIAGLGGASMGKHH